ncbi:hypothetical protein OG912_38740 (plasmid) [Streptomyces sp. NBC_00464]|uniref:hypothetical protein n=1 Tax=Streptomyces sp. NBC_00464 TaxID=2975751 RepID=UPI002E172F13
MIRLITSLMDHKKYPAADLAELYARRWEIDLVFDEIKTHQRDAGSRRQDRSTDIDRGNGSTFPTVGHLAA